jgi:hypothetical protein
MKKLILAALSIFGIFQLSAQTIQLSPQVLASGGNNFEGSDFEISYTIGELAAISTISSSNLTLTQGFHQPDKFTVILVEEVNTLQSVNLFPNPADEFAKIRIESAKPYELMLQLYDASSRLISTTSIQQMAGIQEHLIETAELAAGIYFIRLSSENGEVDKILKMNKNFN